MGASAVKGCLMTNASDGAKGGQAIPSGHGWRHVQVVASKHSNTCFLTHSGSSLSVHNFTASFPGSIKAISLDDRRADTDAAQRASDANFTANSELARVRTRTWSGRAHAQFRPQHVPVCSIMKVERRFISPLPQLFRSTHPTRLLTTSQTEKKLTKKILRRVVGIGHGGEGCAQLSTWSGV